MAPDNEAVVGGAAPEPADYPRGGEAAEAYLTQALEALETLPYSVEKSLAIARIQEAKQRIAEIL
jgi:hypothetical protein